MHDCALKKKEGPSSPRVEHRFFASEGINGKNDGGRGGIIIKDHIEFDPYRGSFFRRLWQNISLLRGIVKEWGTTFACRA